MGEARTSNTPAGQAGKLDNIPRGIMLVITAMIIFASHDALIKTISTGYSPFQILWVRNLLFCTFALALALRKRPLRQVFSTANPRLQLTRSLMLFIDMTLFVIAVSLLPLADTHAIMATYPLMVTALSAILLHEQVGIRRWSAVGVCFIGVLVILRPGLTALQPGALVALTAAVFFSAYIVLTRLVSRYDSGETSLLYTALVGLMVTTVVLPFVWQAPSVRDWGLLVVIAMAGTTAHYLLIKALEAAPASVLQPFNYVLLLWATIVGFLVFGQFPDRWTISGAAIIVGSGLYVIYRERQLK